MKWSIIRVGIITMFMGMTTIVFGMTDDDREQRRAERHQRKLEQYKSGWNRLIPKYQNVQYAGSMGLLSLGVGWDYGRKKQCRKSNGEIKRSRCKTDHSFERKRTISFADAETGR